MKGFYDPDIFKDEKTYNCYEEKKEKGQALKNYNIGDKIEVKMFPTFQITYQENSGFAAYECSLIIEDNDETPDTFSLTGQFIAPLDIGHSYSVIGIVTEREGDKQLTVDKIVKIEPLNKPSTISFLRTLSGAGVYAELIYDEYKNKTIDVIKKQPLKLLNIAPSIYKDLVLGWQSEVLNLEDDQKQLYSLMEYGLSITDAKKIYTKYGIKSLSKIESNPYFLSKELENYSFKKSDNIAMNIGYSPTHPDRIQVGILHILNQAKWNKGHIYLPLEELLNETQDVLSIKMTKVEMNSLLEEYSGYHSFKYKVGNHNVDVNYNQLEEAIDKYNNAKNKKEQQDARYKLISINKDDILKELKILQRQNRVIIIKNRVYNYTNYMKERSIANNIRDIVFNEKELDIDTESYLKEYLDKNNIVLEKEQYKAVLNTCSSVGGFFVIDGSAGCGKTFVLKIILDILKRQYFIEQNSFHCMLMAPTGKAAKVMEASTDFPATTVHRALKYHPKKGFYYNGRNKFPTDCIVLDESSMLDVDLAEALLKAISPKTKVIFIGDTKQLISVGAGNVLKDIIISNKVNINTLKVVKRQGEDSGIIKNANKIINKEMIESNKETNDVVVKKVKNELSGLKAALQYYKLFSNKLGINETQILAPQKSGIIGVNNFNYYIQKIVNKEKELEGFYHKTIESNNLKTGKAESVDIYFKKGDKVINTINDYDIKVYKLKGKRLILDKNSEGIMNGDIGYIIGQKVRTVKGIKEYSLWVQYDDNIVIYINDFSSIDLAYAMTIHKSQGSEWKAVILPVFRSNYMMLDNHLLYTGYTRAKEYNIVLHDDITLKSAIQSYRSSDRYTSLDEQLINLFNL